MADRFFSRFFGKLGKGQIKLGAGGDTVRVVLVDNGYTPNTTAAGHEFLSDIPVGTRHGNRGSNLRADAPQVLLNDPTADGIYTAASPTVTFQTIPATGAVMPYLVLFKDDGVSDATSPLILVLDTTPGLPLTPNGADTILTFNPAMLFTL